MLDPAPELGAGLVEGAPEVKEENARPSERALVELGAAESLPHEVVELVLRRLQQGRQQPPPRPQPLRVYVHGRHGHTSRARRP